MPIYEYKVIPAPRRGEKARGAKSTAERFAYALTQVMNDLGRDGWEYLRADTLPCEERVGLTGKATAFQNMLVFRRSLAEAAGGQAAGVQAAADHPMPAITALSPQGAAPRIDTIAEATGPIPSLGAARKDDLAAE